MSQTMTIEKIRGRFCIMAGTAKLASFKTEQAAQKELTDNFEMLHYWANSAGVSIQNKPAKVVSL